MIYKNLNISDLEGEIWLPIENFPHYKVSNMGRIKSLKRYVRRGKSGTYLKEKIKSQRLTKGGYLITDLYEDFGCKTWLVHILVAKTFIPNPLLKTSVNHKFGVKTDNRVSELEWATPKENTQHGISLGLIDSKGEKCGTSKLKDYQVLEIRERYKRNDIPYSKKNGMPLREIGKIYGVSAATVKGILSRKKWKHI